jgi:uncharacterized protein (DUF433 family)
MFDENFDRITQNPSVMGGKPCIRGMRVTVGMIVGQIGAGVSVEELLSDYPYLEREDIMQAVRYAADIDKGALVTVDPRKTRVTVLPL